MTKKELRDLITEKICDGFNPKTDILGVYFSRKQLRQLMNNKFFRFYLDKRCAGNYLGFCDSKTVHHKIFQKAFGEEYCWEYKQFMKKIYRCEQFGKKIQKWKSRQTCLERFGEYEGESPYIYLYNLYGEVRNWINGTAFEIKKVLKQEKS